MADIKVFNENNEMQIAEGISYFKVNDSGKRYLFYTLNEKPDVDLLKIHVINVVDDGMEAEQIDDTTWKYLTGIMAKIIKHNDLSELEFLNWENVDFHIGNQRPKKIAIKDEQKEEFVNNQINSVADKVKNNDTPIVEETAKEEETIFNTPMQIIEEVKEERSENMVTLTQEQLDTIKKALDSINEVINNAKIVEETKEAEVTSVPPIEEVSPVNNVLEEEAPLTMVNEPTVAPVSVEPVITHEEAPIEMGMPPVEAPVMEHPVGEAPVMEAPVQEVSAMPVIESVEPVVSQEPAQYVASSGTNVGVQNPTPTPVQEVPVVMPNDMAQTPIAMGGEVYGPASLTPGEGMAVESARPIEGTLQQEQSPSLTLVA